MLLLFADSFIQYNIHNFAYMSNFDNWYFPGLYSSLTYTGVKIYIPSMGPRGGHPKGDIPAEQPQSNLMELKLVYLQLVSNHPILLLLRGGELERGQGDWHDRLAWRAVALPQPRALWSVVLFVTRKNQGDAIKVSGIAQFWTRQEFFSASFVSSKVIKIAALRTGTRGVVHAK